LSRVQQATAFHSYAFSTPKAVVLEQRETAYPFGGSPV